MSTIVNNFSFLPASESAKRFSIMLGSEDDMNVQHILKKAFEVLGSTAMSSILVTTFTSVLAGAHRNDGSGLPRTPTGQFLKELREGTWTNRNQLKQIGLRIPKNKRV